jgi:hypothetical protein
MPDFDFSRLTGSSSSDERTRTIWNGVTDVWVYEVEDDDDAKGRALVFETQYGKRVAFLFPENWREMTDAQLLAVSDRTPD